VVHAERGAGTPLHLLLDDLSGVSLVSRFALALWPQRWPVDWKDAREIALHDVWRASVLASSRDLGLCWAHATRNRTGWT
jgi:hypothetical protein